MNQKSLSILSLGVALLFMVSCSNAGDDSVAQGSDFGPGSSDTISDVPETQAATNIAVDLAGVPNEVDAAIFDSKEVVTTDLCAVRMNDVSLSGRPTEVPDKASVWFQGWFGERETMSWPGSPSLYIRKDGSGGRVWEVKLPEPIPRGDVARSFKTETMRNTGFSVESNLSALPAGNFRLMLAFNKDDKQHRCDRGRIIQLK